MQFIMLLVLLYVQFFSTTGVIPINVNIELTWDEDASIAGMERFMEMDEFIQETCGREAHGIPRWGANWTREVRCTRLCKLEEFLGHETWNSSLTVKEKAQSVCWGSFKDVGVTQLYTPLQFLESYGQHRADLITSKGEWVVDHLAKENTHLVEMVPQGRAAVLHLSYSYKLESSPPWFFGTSQDTAH